MHVGGWKYRRILQPSELLQIKEGRFKATVDDKDTLYNMVQQQTVEGLFTLVNIIVLSRFVSRTVR